MSRKDWASGAMGSAAIERRRAGHQGSTYKDWAEDNDIVDAREKHPTVDSDDQAPLFNCKNMQRMGVRR